VITSDLKLTAMNVAHRTVIRVTGGRLGWQGGGMPVLELTTIGRRTGEPRVTMLTSPLQEGDSIVVAALGSGGDRQPAWYQNLRETPQVRVRWAGGDPQVMTATAVRGAQRDDMWTIITEQFPDYATCQTETERELPLVLLEPAG